MDFSAPEDCPIVVIGAGIGGLAFARARQLLNRQVQILEKAPSLREVGSAILLGANATGVLKRLGLLSQIQLQGAEVEVARILDQTGSTLVELALDFENPTVVCHRATLQFALLESVPRNWIQTGAEVLEVGSDKDHAWCRTGDSTLRSPLVVGADGIHSTPEPGLTAPLHPDKTAFSVGVASWRTLTRPCLKKG